VLVQHLVGVLQVAALAEVLARDALRGARAWSFSGVPWLVAAMSGPYCVYWILAQKARPPAVDVEIVHTVAARASRRRAGEVSADNGPARVIYVYT
jgi:hypothetical protein